MVDTEEKGKQEAGTAAGSSSSQAMKPEAEVEAKTQPNQGEVPEVLGKEDLLAKEAEVERSTHYVEPEVLPIMDRISKAITSVTMFLPAFIVLIMFYEVVLRYFFKSPTLWVNEMSLWVAGFVYLFAGLHTMQQRAHIRVTVIYDMVSPKVRRIFDFISLMCIVLFTTGLIAGSYKAVYKTVARWETFGTAWDPPIPATVKPMILIVTFLVMSQAISNYLNDDDAYGNPKKRKAKKASESKGE